MAGTSDYLKGNWKWLKGKFKENYAELTDDDLMYEEGKEDQLMGRLQTRLGKTKAQIEDEMLNWRDNRK